MKISHPSAKLKKSLPKCMLSSISSNVGTCDRIIVCARRWCTSLGSTRYRPSCVHPRANDRRRRAHTHTHIVQSAGMLLLLLLRVRSACNASRHPRTHIRKGQIQILWSSNVFDEYVYVNGVGAHGTGDRATANVYISCLSSAPAIGDAWLCHYKRACVHEQHQSSSATSGGSKIRAYKHSAQRQKWQSILERRKFHIPTEVNKIQTTRWETEHGHSFHRFFFRLASVLSHIRHICFNSYISVRWFDWKFRIGDTIAFSVCVACFFFRFWMSYLWFLLLLL